MNTRLMEYEKIIHVCEERIRQIKLESEIPISDAISKTKDEDWSEE